MNRGGFETNGIYHIYNRGADRRNIFDDNSDRQRFLDNLTEFNDLLPAVHWREKDSVLPESREMIVEILAFCMMRNHYHLMLRQTTENGIRTFMQKLGTGYTMYFNKKYERTGVLFQGRYKSVPATTQEQLRYLPHYIHLNPAPSLESNAAWKKLEQYRWSSFHDYTGRNIYPEIVKTAFRDELYGSTESYANDLRDWMKIRMEKEKELAEVLFK